MLCGLLGLGAREPVERVDRHLARGAAREGSLVLGEEPAGIGTGAVELLVDDRLAVREHGVRALGFAGETGREELADALPGFGRADRLFSGERREDRVARGWRLAPGEEEHARFGDRLRVAAREPLAQPVACDLGVVAGELREFRAEEVPLPGGPERAQPLAPQAVDERAVLVTREERLDFGGV